MVVATAIVLAVCLGWNAVGSAAIRLRSHNTGGAEISLAESLASQLNAAANANAKPSGQSQRHRMRHRTLQPDDTPAPHLQASTDAADDAAATDELIIERSATDLAAEAEAKAVARALEAEYLELENWMSDSDESDGLTTSQVEIESSATEASTPQPDPDAAYFADGKFACDCVVWWCGGVGWDVVC